MASSDSLHRLLIMIHDHGSRSWYRQCVQRHLINEQLQAKSIQIWTGLHLRAQPHLFMIFQSSSRSLNIGLISSIGMMMVKWQEGFIYILRIQQATMARLFVHQQGQQFIYHWSYRMSIESLPTEILVLILGKVMQSSMSSRTAASIQQTRNSIPWTVSRKWNRLLDQQFQESCLQVSMLAQNDVLQAHQKVTMLIQQAQISDLSINVSDMESKGHRLASYIAMKEAVIQIGKAEAENLLILLELASINQKKRDSYVQALDYHIEELQVGVQSNSSRTSPISINDTTEICTAWAIWLGMFAMKWCDMAICMYIPTRTEQQTRTWQTTTIGVLFPHRRFILTTTITR